MPQPALSTLSPTRRASRVASLQGGGDIVVIGVAEDSDKTGTPWPESRFPKTNIFPPIQRGTLSEHSRRRTSPASGIQSHALSHDAPASMRTRTPLGVTSVRGFECTAHSPGGLRNGGLTLAPVPRETPRAMPAFVLFRDVGCLRRCNRPPMRASDRAGWTSTRRRAPPG